MARDSLILDKIDALKNTRNDGAGLYFIGLEIEEVFASLSNFIDLPERVVHEIPIRQLIINTIRKIGQDPIKKEVFMEYFNELLRIELSSREMKYHLVTSISIKEGYPEAINLGRAVIRFASREDSRFYRARGDMRLGSRFSLSHRSYSYVAVEVMAKTTHGAAKRALDALDLFRAILSLVINPALVIGSDEAKPINEIRLGQVHTLHFDDGRLIDDVYWHEPNFEPVSSPKKLRNDEAKLNAVRTMLSQFECSKYNNSVLRESLISYVRALDEKDQNTAVIKLWSAFERLASPDQTGDNKKYDRLVTRASFLFRDVSYHRLMLEHLREYRNSMIHSGFHSDDSRIYCYQLQSYYRKLIIFHLKSHFRSLDEANSILDFPSDLNSLGRQKELLTKAIEIRSEIQN